MILSRVSCAFLLPIALASSIWAASESLADNPSQWTSRDVFQILTNSPWSRPVKVNSMNEGSDSFGNRDNGPDSNANNTPPPPTNMGGMGRRGMGGTRSGGSYSSGGRAAPTSSSRSGPTVVTIQWQSALVVRMAAMKKDGQTVEPSAVKPPGEYVIAVIGLPLTAVGGRAATADSQAAMTSEDEQRIEQAVKTSAALVRSGHEPLTPSKVELDQGRDGRMLVHFPLTDPIQPNNKSVEFRLVMGKTKLEKKFPLREMEYQGKLEL